MWQRREVADAEGNQLPTTATVQQLGRGIYPINTVAAPMAIALGAPASTTTSPCRAAGSPPIITVRLPIATMPPTCGLDPSEILPDDAREIRVHDRCLRTRKQLDRRRERRGNRDVLEPKPPQHRGQPPLMLGIDP